MIDFEDAQIVINVYKKVYNEPLKSYKAGELNNTIAHCNEVLNMLNQIEKFLKLLDDLDNLKYVKDDLPMAALKVLDRTTVDYHFINALIEKWEDKE